MLTDSDSSEIHPANQALEAALSAVTDERTFLAFLSELANNRQSEKEIETRSPSSPWGSGALGWEHGDIENFIGAAASWGEASIEGLAAYQPSENPWKRCAEILHMGKLYE